MELAELVGARDRANQALALLSVELMADAFERFPFLAKISVALHGSDEQRYFNAHLRHSKGELLTLRGACDRLPSPQEPSIMICGVDSEQLREARALMSQGFAALNGAGQTFQTLRGGNFYLREPGDPAPSAELLATRLGLPNAFCAELERRAIARGMPAAAEANGLSREARAL